MCSFKWQALRTPSNWMNYDQPLAIPGFPHPIFGSLMIFPYSSDRCLPTEGLWGWSLAMNAPAEDRTLFLTFSKGHPVTEAEVRELFNGDFGDCVDNVWMDDFNSADQSLYARMEVRTVSTVDHILGGQNVAKFRVNGKQVWARKFESRANNIIWVSLEFWLSLCMFRCLYFMVATHTRQFKSSLEWYLWGLYF